jgi:preprotein translocase subunit SecA
VVIPTNLAMIRKDENDLVFRTFQEKVDAIIGDIKDCYARGQPVLVGTTSIEKLRAPVAVPARRRSFRTRC